MGRVALFTIIFWRNKMQWSKKHIFLQSRIAFENALESVFLFVDIPAESISYAPTFFKK